MQLQHALYSSLSFYKRKYIYGKEHTLNTHKTRACIYTVCIIFRRDYKSTPRAQKRVLGENRERDAFPFVLKGRVVHPKQKKNRGPESRQAFLHICFVITLERERGRKRRERDSRGTVRAKTHARTHTHTQREFLKRERERRGVVCVRV